MFLNDRELYLLFEILKLNISKLENSDLDVTFYTEQLRLLNKFKDELKDRGLNYE